MKNLKIPRNERLEETHKRNDGKMRVVTSNKDRSKWYWNDINEDGTLTRIQTGKSPSEFQHKDFWNK